MIVQTMLTSYPLIVRPDVMSQTGEPCFVAEYPDLPGCIGYGKAEAEAIATLDKARVAYTAYVASKGIAVARPGSSVTWSIGAGFSDQSAGYSMQDAAGAFGRLCTA